MVYTTGRVDLEYILHNDPVEAIKGRFERAAEKAAIILYFPFPQDAALLSTEKEFAGRYFVPPEKVWMLYDIILNHRMTPLQTIRSLGLEKLGYDEAESLADQWTKERFRLRFDARQKQEEQKEERERRAWQEDGDETVQDIIQDMRDSLGSIRSHVDSAEIRRIARERSPYDEHGFRKRKLGEGLTYPVEEYILNHPSGGTRRSRFDRYRRG